MRPVPIGLAISGARGRAKIHMSANTLRVGGGRIARLQVTFVTSALRIHFPRLMLQSALPVKSGPRLRKGKQVVKPASVAPPRIQLVVTSRVRWGKLS